LEIWEVHGDEPRALKDSGFRQVGGLLRAGGDGTKRGGQATSTKDLLQVLSRHAQLTGVTGPKLTTRLGHRTGLKMGLGVTNFQLHYMVRTGEKTFELQSLPAEDRNSLGLEIDLTPQAVPNDPELFTISPLKVTFATVDGHEPVPGVELEIGKPIISTRKLETSLTVEDGDAVAIMLPGPEGRQPILFVTVHRVGKTQ
jgi:type II secretory pathway component GspD/PulD (secretin)